MTAPDLEQLERERAGLALKNLRKRAPMSQEEAADRTQSGSGRSISLSNWKNFEWGKRAMDNASLASALAAIGVTPEEYKLELARLDRLSGALQAAAAPATGLADNSRPYQLPLGGIARGGAMPTLQDSSAEAVIIDFMRFFTPGTQVLKLPGMEMAPYADAGGFVTYNRQEPGKRGQGCVIEWNNGDFAVRRFERFEGEALIVTKLYPKPAEESYPLSEIKGVYAIGLRGD